MPDSVTSSALTCCHLLESGKVKPVIDRIYPFAELPQAVGQVAGRHARGKVVVSVHAGEATVESAVAASGESGALGVKSGGPS